jgi:hypothetical protein
MPTNEVQIGKYRLVFYASQRGSPMTAPSSMRAARMMSVFRGRLSTAR